MAWATPQYSKGRVDTAGSILISEESPENAHLIEEAQIVTNNWRSSHGMPLNTFRKTLRLYATRLDSQSLVAQRIKRLSSIELKLRRFPTMKLSQMQDLGGCRAIVNSVQTVNSLVSVYTKSTIKHKLVDIDDYIKSPKSSGYRGIHLIYRYYTTYKTEAYNGLKIEIQLRTGLQHAWATAVETVGTFISQALKSSQGEEGWLRFFALMSTAIAQREKGAIVPNTPSDKRALTIELQSYVDKLDVVRILEVYAAALQTVTQPSTKNAQYFLLQLDPSARTVAVTGYRANELERASNEYLESERRINEKTGAQAVLVSVDSLASLRRAFPNYFLDTSLFIAAVNEAVQ